MADLCAGSSQLPQDAKTEHSGVVVRTPSIRKAPNSKQDQKTNYLKAFCGFVLGNSRFICASYDKP